jgi:hypothetical protein
VRNDGSDGTSGLSSVFLLDDLGTARLPEAVQVTNLARCERRCRGRGAIRTIRVIRCIRTPFVCAAGPLRAGIYDEGEFGCVGIGRISRIASGTGQDTRATRRIFCSTALGRKRFPRPFTKRTRATVRRHRSRLRARDKSANIGVIEGRNPRQVLPLWVSRHAAAGGATRPRPVDVSPHSRRRPASRREGLSRLAGQRCCVARY